MSVYQSKVEIGREQISIETGKWAKQAHGSIVYRVGNLVLLGTVCASKDAREDQDFFPLTVDYREKLYAVGRFPGGYIKRENRPADHETLLSRMIDRPIRPLFPEGYFSEVQLLITVISADANTCIEGHAITAASAALMVSDIPFHGPIAGVVVGRIDGEFILNPTSEELEKSDLELIVAGSRDAVTMIEGGSTEFSNEEMLSAIQFAHDKIKGMLNFQEELAKEIGISKREIIQRLPDPKVLELVREYAYEKMKAASQNSDKATREAMVSGLYKETVDYFKGKIESDPAGFGFVSIKDVKNFLHEIEADVVRTQIFEKKIRADGRALDEIRDISVELDVLPGAHGSAVFTRGQTQSLGVATLGTPSDNQRYENLSGQKTKNFMLHYNFPPFSVGEVKRMAGPGRREIGHGNLAERAIARMLPVNTEFPYVIRLVSEILESNGSSSMASVCSGSLALMAAGVPIKNSVSGIAMGLITNKDGRFAILSDIAGIEDHFGDMDFKVAGTKKGITALQLDIKVTGISMEVMREALEQASKGRDHILGKMDEVLADARSTIPRNAPRITSLQIDPERIGELIGPGGKMIRSIIEKSGADINVDDTGTVLVSSVDSSSSELACQMIQDIFREVEVGTIYEGVVKKIADFGAFVEILPGKEGLCHISKLDVQRVNSVRDIVNEGDAITVKVIGVDRQGRIDLSRKDVLDPNASQGGNGDEGRRDGDNGRGRPGGRDDSRERRPMNRPRR